MSCARVTMRITSDVFIRDITDCLADLLNVSTLSWVAICMPAICAPISSVALQFWFDSDLTSDATMRKIPPRFTRHVRLDCGVRASSCWLAIAVISLTTSPIR